MDAIEIKLTSSDREMADAIKSSLSELRGKGLDGTRLVPMTSDEFEAADPLTTIVTIAFLTSVAAGAGKKLGEAAIVWLIAAIKKNLSKNKSVSLKTKGREITLTSNTTEKEITKFSKEIGRDYAFSQTLLRKDG